MRQEQKNKFKVGDLVRYGNWGLVTGLPYLLRRGDLAVIVSTEVKGLFHVDGWEDKYMEVHLQRKNKTIKTYIDSWSLLE
jgi:hypothetical protein